MQDDARGLGLDVHAGVLGGDGVEGRVQRRKPLCGNGFKLDRDAVDLGPMTAHEQEVGVSRHLADRTQVSQCPPRHQRHVHPVAGRQLGQQGQRAGQGSRRQRFVNQRREDAVEVQRQ